MTSIPLPSIDALVAFEEELNAGKLVALAPVRRSRNSYYLAVPETKVGTPHVQAFVKWIEERAMQFRPSQRRLRKGA